jgi:deoxyribodipyrimidine photolyase-related protein
MKTAFLLFPHQLFKQTEVLKSDVQLFLIEEYLFFKQYKYHQQKIKFHRATMKAYLQYLNDQGLKPTYIESTEAINDIRCLLPELRKAGFEKIVFYDVSDNWLNKRLQIGAIENSLIIETLDSPYFLNTKAELHQYFESKKRYFQTDFYVHERKKRNILIELNQQPIGGKWTFDTENRLKYPKDKKPPTLDALKENDFHQEANKYVAKYFGNHYGTIDKSIIFPATFVEAEIWLNNFFITRFQDFGLYEDAIVADEYFLHHSVISPLLNVGLLLPQQVIDQAIEYATRHAIPMNSLEGFIRQIMGWREFMRAVYEREGTKERSMNYWGFDRKIPSSFYNGTTGIEPLDNVIKSLQKTAYSHHIERLMIVSNFMLLCEFHPDEVYQWFMEMYIDAYDWVMVPNVYGMGQFADGGLITSKPYISGSNYIFKMSHYKKNQPWAEIWDALFWRFMHIHRSFFLKNPRLGMLVHTFDKMTEEKKNMLLQKGDDFLASLEVEKNKDNIKKINCKHGFKHTRH